MIARRLVIAAACLFSLPALGYVMPSGAPAKQTAKPSPAKVAWAEPPVRVQPVSMPSKPVTAPTPQQTLALAAPKVEQQETTPAAAPTVQPQRAVVAAPKVAPVPAPTEEEIAPRSYQREPAAPKAQALARTHPVALSKPAGYRAAKFAGGEGASWKTARNAYAFAGNYGGCRFSGRLGPGGFSLDRICR